MRANFAAMAITAALLTGCGVSDAQQSGKRTPPEARPSPAPPERKIGPTHTDSARPRQEGSPVPAPADLRRLPALPDIDPDDVAAPISGPFAPPRTPLPPQLPAPPPPSLLFGITAAWGEQGGISGWNRDGRGARLADLMQSAGVTNVCVVVRWSEIAPEPGQFRWKELDDLLRFLKERGFVLTCAVTGTPGAIRGAGKEPAGQPGPELLAEAGRLATMLGARYKERVHRWEVWPEPDRSPESGEAVGASAYAQLLKVVARGLRKAEPGCLVAVGGLTRETNDFLEGLYSAGAQSAFDAVSLHPRNGAGTLAWIDACRNTLLKHGDAGKKLWVTRWGWPSYPAAPEGLLEGEQARRIRSFLQALQKRPFVEMAAYEALFDYPMRAGDPLSLRAPGLCARDLRPKPAFQAFQAAARGPAFPIKPVRRVPLLAGLPEALALTPEADHIVGTARARAVKGAEALLQAASPQPAESYIRRLLANTIHLDINPGEIVGAQPRLWRGLTLPSELSGRLPLQVRHALAALTASGATLARITAPAVTTGVLPVDAEALAEEDPRITELLEEVVQAGAEPILAISPPRSGSLPAWKERISAFARRYASDEKSVVARWELLGTAEEAARWFAPFAQAIRAVKPTAPVGIFLSSGDPVDAARRLALSHTQTPTPVDSMAWRESGTPESVARTLPALRAALGAHRETLLLPELDPGEDGLAAVGAEPFRVPAWALAAAARLTDLAPPDQPNMTLGLTAPYDALVSASGRPTSLWTALALLNRLPAARIAADSDDGRVRLLASRGLNGAFTLLAWRDTPAVPEASSNDAVSGAEVSTPALSPGESGDVLMLTRLRGLGRIFKRGLRMEQYLLDETHPGMSAFAAAPAVSSKQPAARDALERAAPAGRRPPPAPAPQTALSRPAEPVAIQDLPLRPADSDAAVFRDDLEIPLTLTTHGVTLLEFTPHPTAPLEIRLTARQHSVAPGRPIALQTEIRNVSARPQRTALRLSGMRLLSGSADAALRSVGTLAPGERKTVTLYAAAPAVAQESCAYLNVQAGTADSRAAVGLRLLSPLSATLPAPRIDLGGPGGRASATVLLRNQERGAVTLTLRAPGMPPQRVSVPGHGQPVAHPVPVAAPRAEPGAYIVPITVESSFGVVRTLLAQVGVPAACAYAVVKPTIDGSFAKWADAVPLGMGRAEQMHGKAWGGPADLSAYAYVRWDDRFFYFACAVTDDIHYQPFAGSDLPRGDSVQFALSADRVGPATRVGYGPGEHEFVLALPPSGQPILHRLAGPAGTAPGPVEGAQMAIVRSGIRVFYEAAIPWTALTPLTPTAGAIYGLSLVVNDNDGDGRGYAAWGSGVAGAKRPGLFPPIRLIRPAF